MDVYYNQPKIFKVLKSYSLTYFFDLKIFKLSKADKKRKTLLECFNDLIKQQ